MAAGLPHPVPHMTGKQFLEGFHPTLDLQAALQRQEKPAAGRVIRPQEEESYPLDLLPSVGVKLRFCRPLQSCPLRRAVERQATGPSENDLGISIYLGQSLFETV